MVLVCLGSEHAVVLVSAAGRTTRRVGALVVLIVAELVVVRGRIGFAVLWGIVVVNVALGVAPGSRQAFEEHYGEEEEESTCGMAAIKLMW